MQFLRLHPDRFLIQVVVTQKVSKKCQSLLVGGRCIVRYAQIKCPKCGFVVKWVKSEKRDWLESLIFRDRFDTLLEKRLSPDASG